MNKEDKFIVADVTDTICIGGFGNDLGNIGLLKYSEQEIANMIIENNTKDDDIRLVNSLLGTIRKQKEVINDYEEDISNLLDIINKNCNELKCTSDEWLVIQKYQDKEVE